MSWSMNEIEALARKAARGAGMCWGLAEETGKATRALLELGIDAAAPLADLLAAHDGADYAQIAPRNTDGVWLAGGDALCPIAAGACLSDMASGLASTPFTLARTRFPLFLIPFAQAAARRLACTVRLEWAGVQIDATATAVHLTGGRAALLAAVTPVVTCTKIASPAGHLFAHAERAEVSPETIARLTAFAHRTYAPATDASRQAGAGAGLSDND